MLTPPATASPLGWTIVQQPCADARNSPTATSAPAYSASGSTSPTSTRSSACRIPVGNIWIYKPVGWANPQGGSALAPAPPTSVNASDGTSTANVAVTWKAVSGATSYSVYRSTTAGSQGTLLGSTASLACIDSSATAGMTYFYGVTASGGGGTSALSAQDSGFRAGALSPTSMWRWP